MTPQPQPNGDAIVRLVTDALPAVVWTTDANLVVTSRLGRHPSRVGRALDAALGRPLGDMAGIVPEAEALLALHRSALLGERTHGEMELAGRMYAIDVEPLEAEGGEIEGCVGVALDVSGAHETRHALDEANRAERALRESEERFRELFEESPISAWEEDFSEAKRLLAELRASGVTDLRAHLREHRDDLMRCLSAVRLIEVNHSSLAMYGANDKAELLESLPRLLDPDNLDEPIEALIAVDESRLSLELEGVERTLDGRRLDVHLSWRVAAGHEADSSRVLVLITDITERKAAEAELAGHREHLEQLVAERTAELTEANVQLAHATRAKDAFLAAMSHELRTPLNSIIGFSSILWQGLPGPLNSEQARMVDMINRSGRQLLSLVGDVLDLAKIESGRVEVDVREFDVARFVETLTETVRPMADEKGLALRVDTAHAPTAMTTDRGKLEQILLNVLSNAVKYTDEGSVDVAVRQEGDVVVIEVRDTGVGIAADDLERIFEEFRQVPVGTLRSPGTGLGLAIARRLAEILRGAVTVESRLGAGSTFSVALPRVWEE